jgi:transketolase
LSDICNKNNNLENRTIQRLAKAIRCHALKLVHQADASHIGSCLSMADLLAVLYGKVLKFDSRNPHWNDRDRVIISKGHSAAIVYSVLYESGFFPIEWLETYCKNGSKLAGHVSHCVPGIEVSTGSLGHGLPIGCGMALAGKRDGRSYRVFVILSDGECNEGSNWEAAIFAPHHQLDNIIVVVDYNKIQGFGLNKEVLDLHPLDEKWMSFGWAVREIDGHNYQQIENALTNVPFEINKPSVIIAHTVKGKGVSFMENQLAWHYKSPDVQQLKQALEELEK